MDLAEYVKERNLLPEEILTTVTNNYLVRKRTFFEELYKNGEIYSVSEETLLQWALEAGGPGYELLESTKGFSTDSDDYAKLGGVEICMNLQVMCIRRIKRALCICTSRPDDPGLVAILNKAFGVGTYTFGICTRNVWDAIYQIEVEPLYIESQARKLESTSAFGQTEKATRRDSEARRVYNHIIMFGIARGASDIHLIPCDHECRVLYKIDGVNYQAMKIPLATSQRVCNILLADGNVPNKGPNVPLDGKIKYVPENSTSEKDVRDLRFSIMPTRRGADINVRFLSNKLYTFSELGMSEHNVKLYERILDMPQGLVMQVGPTGSGKSTTLYAGIKFITDSSLRNIITGEDPVEILMEGITQVDVNEEAGLTFARISRQFLRHDVDVGIIGEIRDEETALEAVRAATTGHLVISSLHSNDSLGVIERLIRLRVDPYTLSEVLVAVMGQRLVRRLCPHCKQEYILHADDEEAVKFGISDRIGADGIKMYRGAGCQSCNNLGFKGRIAVNEILVVDRTLRDMIQRHVTRREMEDHLRQINFKTMFSDACDKALSGVTALSELEAMRSDTLAFK